MIEGTTPASAGSISDHGEPMVQSYDELYQTLVDTVEATHGNHDSDIPWGVPTPTKRGALMADPGTKGLLTLLNLIAEEEASLNQQLGRQVTTADLKVGVVIRSDTRHVSTAGDDHIAIGNENYLNDITRCHIKNNMVPHKRKHSTSKHAAKYTEAYICNLPHTRFVEPKGYRDSCMVDTVKLRLVSPETKPAQTIVNPIIGKGPAYIRRAAWMPSGWTIFCSAIGRARMLARNTKYLPRHDGNYDRKVELPRALGGLSLSPWRWKDWDPGPALKRVSPRHLKAIEMVLKGERGIIKRILSRFSGDRYARGVSTLDIEEDSIKSEFLEDIPSYDLKTVKAKLVDDGKLRGNEGFRILLKKISSNQYLEERDLLRKLRNLEVQKKLVRASHKSGFEHSSWEERYRVLENQLTEQIPEVKDASVDKVKALLKKYKNPRHLELSLLEDQVYYHADELVRSKEGDGFLNIPAEILRDNMSLELPTLFEATGAIASSELSGWSSAATPTWLHH